MTGQADSLKAPFALVWLQTGFIGDIVLTTAAIALAQRHWPDKQQYVITTRVGAEVLAGAPQLAARLVFDKTATLPYRSMHAVKAQLRSLLGPRGRAVVLQAHRSTRSSLLAMYLGWPTVAYRESPLAMLAQWRVPRVAVLHEAHRIALLLEPLGVARAAITAALPLLTPLPLAEDVPWQARLAKLSGRVIAIAPGSIWGTKRWPPSAFATLTRSLLDLEATTILFIGSSAEIDLAAAVSREVGPTPRLLNLVGETSLDDMRRIMPRCDLLVANDSSPVHYASAFRIPTVELFGATVPGMGFGPLAPRSRALGIELACRPCSDHGPQVCPLEHFRCMRDLQPNAVLAACADLLSTPRHDN